MDAQQPSPSTTVVLQHLQSVLPATGRTALATSLLPALLDSIAAIASALRSAHHVALAGGTNAFGDDQLNVDVTAENLVRAALAGCPSVATASSEEDPVERVVSAAAAKDDATEVYTVAFDPLDGSSIIAPNWTVGTIAGVWDGPTALGTRPADAQVAAVLGVYGPRTTAIVALRAPGQHTPVCLELGLSETSSSSPGDGGGGGGSWDIVRSAVRLSAEDTLNKIRYFAPANARAAAEDARYRDLILHYITSKYTLRYSGGLVPDVMHMLVKGHGVYLSPVTTTSKAKLRRLYELCPVALVLECAGGKAIDAATFQAVLDTPLVNTDERGGLVCGTANEVDKAAARLQD